jgi:hypothetical protein
MFSEGGKYDKIIHKVVQEFMFQTSKQGIHYLVAGTEENNRLSEMGPDT